jgi:hypothetical protein
MKQETTVRINSRLFPAQKKFIKDLAVKLKKSEGQVTREIIQFFIDKSK